MERGISGGCIPQNWMQGIFGTSLPPEQSCWIWDWILVREDPHAGIFHPTTYRHAKSCSFNLLTCKCPGIFLVCALFGLHSEAILQLDGARFFDWIAAITTGASKDSLPWVQLLPLDSGILGNENAGKPNFDNYTRAWIHASDGIK
jgi:hypothetical protein